MKELFENKEFLTILTLLIVQGAGILKQHLSTNKAALKQEEIAKKAEAKQNEIAKKNTTKIFTISEKVNKIANIIEIKDFKESFISAFISNQRKFISTLKIDSCKKDFLNAGILELSNVFEFILIRKFEFSESDFKAEIENSEINLVAKFKNKQCGESLSKYRDLINLEIKEFNHKLKSFIILKENGERMVFFKNACYSLSSDIIKNIAK